MTKVSQDAKWGFSLGQLFLPGAALVTAMQAINFIWWKKVSLYGGQLKLNQILGLGFPPGMLLLFK